MKLKISRYKLEDKYYHVWMLVDRHKIIDRRVLISTNIGQLTDYLPSIHRIQCKQRVYNGFIAELITLNCDQELPQKLNSIYYWRWQCL
jgi:hypothetical protein